MCQTVSFVWKKSLLEKKGIDDVNKLLGQKIELAVDGKINFKYRIDAVHTSDFGDEVRVWGSKIDD